MDYDTLCAIAPEDDPWMRIDRDANGNPMRIIVTVYTESIERVRNELAKLLPRRIILIVQDVVPPGVSMPPYIPYDALGKRIKAWADEITGGNYLAFVTFDQRGNIDEFDFGVLREHYDKMKATVWKDVVVSVWINE